MTKILVKLKLRLRSILNLYNQ